MSTGLKVGIAGVLGFIAMSVMLVIFIVTVKFQAEKFENQLEASYQNMQNVYANVDKTLTSSGLTVSNYGETVINAIKEGIKRYEGQPNLMMQWVQENNQQIDSSVWKEFQKQIESLNKSFEMEQKSKISISQAYKDFLETTFKGQIAQIIWSFPSKEAIKMMNQVIQTQDTKDSFETGIEKPKDYLK